MSNSISTNSDYINFLYCGPDKYSLFNDEYNKTTIYKNKYNRIINKNKTGMSFSFNVAMNICKAFILFLKDNLIENDKITYIDKMISTSMNKFLPFNNSISLSFIENVIHNDSEWEQQKESIKSLLGDFYKYIHDDSYNEYRILTFEIDLSLFNESERYIPDITNYNIEILNKYMSYSNPLLYDNEVGLSLNFSNVKDYYYEKCDNKIVGNSDMLIWVYRNLLQYLKDESVVQLIIFQHDLFNLIINNFSIVKNDILQYKNFLLLFMSFDIVLCNKTLAITDEKILNNIFTSYNFYIIKLQDVLDSMVETESNRKNFVLMYKTQLFKSRNKIQEYINKLP